MDLDPDGVVDGRLALPGLAADNELVVAATMAYSHDGQGLHRATDPADHLDYVYGHLFLDAAPSVYACFDQPDLKAPYDVTVHAPLDWTVIGNGAADADGAGHVDARHDEAARDVLRDGVRRARTSPCATSTTAYPWASTRGRRCASRSSDTPPRSST